MNKVFVWFNNLVIIPLLDIVVRVTVYIGWRGEKLPNQNVVAVRDIIIPLSSGGRRTTAQVLTYQGHNNDKNKKPLILYFPGGGGCIGSIRTSHYNLLRALVAKLECTVVAVDYRLAPSHVFPAGVNDCIETTEWTMETMEKNPEWLLQISLGR